MFHFVWLDIHNEPFELQHMFESQWYTSTGINVLEWDVTMNL